MRGRLRWILDPGSRIKTEELQNGSWSRTSSESKSRRSTSPEGRFSRFKDSRKEERRSSRSPEKRKERQSLKDRLGWRKEENGENQKKPGVKERLGKRTIIDSTDDNDGMSSQSQRSESRSRSRTRSQPRQTINRVGVRARLGKRRDTKSSMESDKSTQGLQSRPRSNLGAETRKHESQEKEVIELKHELEILRQELAKSNYKQQLRDQSLEDEKQLALKAGTQINEKNLELQTSLESIREEKKAIERERDEVIVANVALAKEAENDRGVRERCEKMNQTLEFEIHRLLKERITLKKSLENQQKEVDDLKVKHEEREAVSTEKCQKYKEVAEEELEDARKMLAKYKEMLIRSNTILTELETRLGSSKEELVKTNKELASYKKELASTKEELVKAKKELAEAKISLPAAFCPAGHRMISIPQTDQKSWHCDLCNQEAERGLRCEEDERFGGACSYNICSLKCVDGRSEKREQEIKKKLEKIQIQVQALEVENQQMKEEGLATKERAETYERVIGEKEKELEAYKREMRQNQELIEHSFVERDALVRKNTFMRSKIKTLQRIVQE